jgi:pyridoxal/pyridoxine/pyridoxamine kinase
VTDNKVFVFSAYNEIATRDASNVKRFWSPVMGGGEWAVYVDETAAEIIKLTVHHKNKIVSPNMLGVRTLTIS